MHRTRDAPRSRRSEPAFRLRPRCRTALLALGIEPRLAGFAGRPRRTVGRPVRHRSLASLPARSNWPAARGECSRQLFGRRKAANGRNSRLRAIASRTIAATPHYRIALRHSIAKRQAAQARLPRGVRHGAQAIASLRHFEQLALLLGQIESLFQRSGRAAPAAGIEQLDGRVELPQIGHAVQLGRFGLKLLAQLVDWCRPVGQRTIMMSLISLRSW